MLNTQGQGCTTCHPNLSSNCIKHHLLCYGCGTVTVAIGCIIVAKSVLGYPTHGGHEGRARDEGAVFTFSNIICYPQSPYSLTCQGLHRVLCSFTTFSLIVV